MNVLYSYKNGDYDCSIYEDGTLVKQSGVLNPNFDFPVSSDIKITNYCGLANFCSYCHEESNTKGKHADLIRLMDVLDELPPGIELAIGGGNPLDHPDLKEFLKNCKQKGFICNLTVNQLHLKKHYYFIWDLINNDLIKGLGISYRKEFLNKQEISFSEYRHSVIHLINGIDDYKCIDDLMKIGYNKFLVLGYKQFGNGVEHYNKFSSEIEEKIKKWYMFIPKYFGKCLVSFDNLAIEQLNIKRFFTEEGWNMFYQGDDFSLSMYIDAVEQKFAPTSRSSERKSFNDYSLKRYFQKYRNK
jgi:MoaA/NifB/PqqE/SkfB family radical SAM enzyme